jgi:hypothetical protein
MIIDISDECFASIFMVEEEAKQTANRHFSYSSKLKMDTSAKFYQTVRRNILEGSTLHSFYSPFVIAPGHSTTKHVTKD